MLKTGTFIFMFISEILLRHLDKRCKNNDSYSLRAFARDLEIDPSNLSKIMSNKIDPQKRTKKRLLTKLGLSPEEVEQVVKGENKSFNEKFKLLELEEYEAVSRWYHDAILELTRLSFFRPNPRWISKSLGITVTQVKLAVDRLTKLGHLRIDENGWHDTTGDNTTILDNDFSNQALRQLQASILELSKDAINRIPANKRSHTSTMVTINKKDIPKVKEKINEFRKELAVFLERANNEADSLYQIQVGFFPLLNE